MGERGYKKAPRFIRGGPLALQILFQPGNVFLQAGNAVFPAVVGLPLHHIQDVVPLASAAAFTAFQSTMPVP